MTRVRLAVALDRPESVLRLACATVLAVFLGVALLVGTGSEGSASPGLAAGIGSLVVALTAFVAAAFVLRTALGCRGRQRRAWLLFAASTVTWGIGAASWAASHLDGDGRASTSPGDLWYLLTVALYATAVLSLPALRSGREWVRIVLDGAIVGLAGAVVMWLVAGSELADGTSSVLGTVSAMAYPLVDLALAIICLGAFNRLGRRRAEESVMFVVGLAFIVITVGDVIAMLARSHDIGTGVALLVDAAWCVGLICLAGAAVLANSDGTTMRLRVDRRRFGEGFAMLPSLAAVTAALLTAFDGLANGTVSSTAVTLLTLIVCLVLLRQTLTLHDNQQLGRSLQVAVDDLEHQATHDALTGLPSRAGLTEQIGQAIARSSGRHTLAALLFVDLDHLKAINDSLGHAAGDQLITTIAERLAARVGPSVARFGGDEFVLVLDDVPSVHALESLAQAVVDDASVPTQIDGHTISPSASVGVAVAEVGVEADELLRRADVALYRAKSLGRQRVAVYDPCNAADARRQVDLEPELRRALELDQLEVHYQPVVELTTGRIDGVEALLRWRHPRRGLLAPDAFLVEATTAGLLGEIGGRTLELACAHHAGSGRHVAINLSTIELTDHLVVERVRHALDSSGIEPSMVTLEITEDVIVDQSIRETIEELRSLGVRLAIDDFGTGNSSLRQLGAYPADYLKVDRTFISRIEFDHDAAGITRAVLRLSGGLGLTAIAEGVETAQQAELLVELGCTMAQGYLFSPAVPIDELRERFPVGHRFELGYCSGPGERSGPRDESSEVSAESASDMMRPSRSATVGRSSIAPTT